MNAPAKKTLKTTEFGDFQTPPALAIQACALLYRLKIRPLTIIKPTCGIGHFLTAAMNQFSDARVLKGFDINAEYIAKAHQQILASAHRDKVALETISFFENNWQKLLRDAPQPILIIGNPPWVTNSQLGAMGSSNLPGKDNSKNHTGLDALTGKSNFDISEWMLIHLLDCLKDKSAYLGVLCKTAVARKVLQYLWKNNFNLQHAAMYLIDSKAHFNAAVDACFFVVKFGNEKISYDCDIYKNIDDLKAIQKIGYRENQLVADVFFLKNTNIY